MCVGGSLKTFQGMEFMPLPKPLGGRGRTTKRPVRKSPREVQAHCQNLTKPNLNDKVRKERRKTKLQMSVKGKERKLKKSRKKKKAMRKHLYCMTKPYQCQPREN